MSQAQSASSVLDPEEWVDAYGNILYRYALARLRDANLAEEAVQETFLAGIRFQAKFSQQGTQIGWLTAILKRKILDHVRRRAKTRAIDDDFDPTPLMFDESGHWKEGVLPSVAPDDRMEKSELWWIVQACIGELPAGQADVFVLSVMEEMESEEICKELGISPSNLWVRLHRARLALAKCVGSKWFDGQESVGRG